MNEALPLFLDLLVRSTLLVLFAWGATALLRRCGGSAAMRHLVWLGAIAGLYLLPLLMLTLPALPLAILPEATAPAATVSAEPIAIARKQAASSEVEVLWAGARRSDDRR